MKSPLAAIAAGIGLAAAIAPAQQASLDWQRGERPVAESYSAPAHGRMSQAEVERLLEDLRTQLAADEGRACELVKAAIRGSNGSPTLAARIFETAATEVPGQLRLLSQCAMAAAPDALAEIQAVVALLDPNSGDAPAGAKCGMEKTPVAAAVEPWPDPLELNEDWVIVIPATNVSWFHYSRTLREAPAPVEVESAKSSKSGLAPKSPKSGMTPTPAPTMEHPPRQAARRPNVVMIVADDLGYGDLGCFGQQRTRTPNLDRLARRGVRLTRHYAGGPVDEAARGVLLTGRHSGRTESAGATLPEVFRHAGYRTAAIGKWAAATSQREPTPAAWGFDTSFGCDTRVMTHSYYPARLLHDGRRIEVNQYPVPAHAPRDGRIEAGKWISGAYAPDLFTDQAVAFIEANRERPFFLYLSCLEPHGPLHPPQDWIDQYPREWDDKPYQGDNSYLPHPRPRAAYAALVSDLDRHVGAVLAALGRNGLADDTMVVFTSDNGVAARGNPDCPFHVGGVDAAFFDSTAGLRGWQGTLFEGGLRVPTIVALPGLTAAGTVDATPSYAADWLPTLCAAAGLATPARTDGENLWPALTGAAAPDRDRPLVWADSRHGGQVAVRIGRFKVLRQGIHSAEPTPWQVYDLDQDPGETTNLAAARPDLTVRAETILAREVTHYAPFLAARQR